MRMDNSQLIAACKKQNRSAQKALYELYAPKMMAVCLRYCRDSEVARDLLHDGFIQVFTRIGSYAGRGSFEGWLRKIFVNLSLENYRKQKQRFVFIDDTENVEMVQDEPFDDLIEIGNVNQNELLEIIQELPDGYRTIFNLFVFEDMSHKEIANTLGISENASRSQYYRAKTMLQKKVQAYLKKIKKIED